MARARTHVTAALVAAAMVLAGCGRDNGGPAAGESAELLGSGPISGEITMWAQGSEGEKLPELLKEFEAANPGVKVNVTPIPWDAAHSKYQTAIAGGTTPDVAMMGTTWMADFASAFEPAPTEIDTSGMFEGSKSSTVVNGTTYGVPWYVDTRVIYYRTDLAAQAGYSSPPATWDEFKAMARAMQTNAGAQWGIALPSSGADAFQTVLPFFWSAGASLVNADGTEWTFDTPQMIDALTDLQSFYTEGIADMNVSTTSTDGQAQRAAFVNGSTAMLIGSPAEIGSIEDAGGPEFSSKYSVMRFPKQQTSTSFVGGSNLAVFKNSENRDAAWRLVQWLSQPQVQASWYKMTGDLPSVEAAWDDPSLSGDPKLAVFRDQLADVKSPPANTGWTQVSAAADTQLERIVKAGVDPAEAVRTLQSTADSIGTGA
jgi:multiple sugar transport system substrate-binding protein